jgi:hypothetical protein
MTSKRTPRKRSPRYKVPNNERVLLTVEHKQTAATLAVLSITGGAMRLTRNLTPGTLAEMKMDTVSGPASAVIEFLGVRHGVQAFRFVHLSDVNRKRVEKALDQLRAQGHGTDRTDLLENVVRLAKRLPSLLQSSARA